MTPGFMFPRFAFVLDDAAERVRDELKDPSHPIMPALNLTKDKDDLVSGE
jgi:hypothetical protein